MSKFSLHNQLVEIPLRGMEFVVFVASGGKNQLPTCSTSIRRFINYVSTPFPAGESIVCNLILNSYLHEKVDHKNVIKRIRDIDNDSSIIPISNDFYNGMNFLCTSYCILFGNEWCADEKPNKETIEKIKSGNYSTIVLSNNQYNMEGFSKHHVYAVTGADDNFVFLSNPYNPNEIQKMTHDDFLSFFKQCYSTEL